MIFNEELREAIATDTERRKYLCSKSLPLFMIVYMWKYLKHDFADFHQEMMSDVRFGAEIQFLLWILFRESAKTTIARGRVLQAIVNAEKHNMYWITYDQMRSDANVRAIANELQGNKRIIADYGHLYYDDSAKDFATAKQKSIRRFTTANGVTLQGRTTQRSMRGELDAENRPDFIVLDDIENDETKKSRIKTQSIINFLGEMLGGMGTGCDVLILANRISRIGVVAFLEEMAARMPRKFRVFEKKLVEDGKPTWDAAWRMTDEEARAENERRKAEWAERGEVLPPDRMVRSVESDKRTLGEARWLQERQNEPAGSGDVFTADMLSGVAMSDLERLKKSLRVGIIIDPSFSTRTESDFCPIGVVGVERWQTGALDDMGEPLSLDRFYVLDGVAERYLPEKSADAAINLAFKWIALGFRVTFVSVEVVSINRDQQDFVGLLQKKMDERGLRIPLVKSRPVGMGNKEQRILDACEPVLSTGRFFVRCDDPENNFWYELEDQFMKFPLAVHDDIPDMVAQGIHELGKMEPFGVARQSDTSDWETGIGSTIKKSVLTDALDNPLPLPPPPPVADNPFALPAHQSDGFVDPNDDDYWKD